MAPKARSPDGAARATIRAGLKPCRLHEAPEMSELPDLQKSSYVSDEGGY